MIEMKSDYAIRLTVVLLTLCMAIGLMPADVYATATEPDGSGYMREHVPITREEFVTMINNVFGYVEKSDNAFSDIPQGDPLLEDFQKATLAGYVTGYPDGSARPKAPITRQEAATALWRAMGVESGDAFSLHFTDNSSIGSYAKGAVAYMVEKGIINGYPDGSFKPHSTILRGEAAVLISAFAEKLYTKAGIYTGTAGKRYGNVIINKENVTLKDMVIDGDLYIAPGVDEGDVVLNNVTVNGEIYIRGGGDNSIRLINSRISRAFIQKRNNKRVRLVAEGSSRVGHVKAQSSAWLTAASLETGGGFTSVVSAMPVIDIDNGEILQLIIDVPVEEVILGTDTALELTENSAVKSLAVTEKAENVEVLADPSAVVDEIKAEKDIVINDEPIKASADTTLALNGDGSMTVSRTAEDGTVSETKTKLKLVELPFTVKVKEEAPTEEATKTSTSSSGSEATPVSITIKDVGINNNVKVSEVLTATPYFIGGTGTVTYKWYRIESGLTPTGSDTLCGTGKTYILTAADKSKYIYCVVTASGSTTGGSRTSNVVGPIETVPTQATLINSITFGGVIPPTRGVAAVTAYTAGASATDHTGTVKWSPTISSVFAAETEYTATVTLTAKPGYRFKTGFTQSDISGLPTASSDVTSISVSRDSEAQVTIVIAYKATEAEAPLRVAFITNGGAPIPEEQLITHNETANRPNNPSRNGYSFVGWYTSESGGEEWDFARAITSDMTLYARWQAITYSVTFNSNGGGSVARQDITIEDSFTLTEPSGDEAPTRSGGYSLEGWFTAEGAKWDFANAVTSDMTLYAYWLLEITSADSGKGYLADDLAGVSTIIIKIPGSYGLFDQDYNPTDVQIQPFIAKAEEGEWVTIRADKAYLSEGGVEAYVNSISLIRLAKISIAIMAGKITGITVEYLT